MKSYINLRQLTPVAGGDVERVGPLPSDLPAGQDVWLMSDLGLGIFTCIANRSGSAYVQGALVSSVGNTLGKTAVTDITAGSRVHAETTGLTADAHIGAICYVVDDAGNGGAAPEGETTIIKRNTATRLEFKEPLTTALAVNDDLTLRGTYNSEAAAAGDLNTTVLGVVVPENGIPAANYGWVQKFGPNSRVLGKASTAITVDKPLIADAGRVTIWGTTAAANTLIGQALGGLATDSVSDLFLAQLACGFMNLTGFADIDANAA